jgi:hypothetical protein
MSWVMGRDCTSRGPAPGVTVASRPDMSPGRTVRWQSLAMVASTLQCSRRHNHPAGLVRIGAEGGCLRARSGGQDAAAPAAGALPPVASMGADGVATRRATRGELGVPRRPPAWRRPSARSAVAHRRVSGKGRREVRGAPKRVRRAPTARPGRRNDGDPPRGCRLAVVARGAQHHAATQPDQDTRTRRPAIGEVQRMTRASCSSDRKVPAT